MRGIKIALLSKTISNNIFSKEGSSLHVLLNCSFTNDIMEKPDYVGKRECMLNTICLIIQTIINCLRFIYEIWHNKKAD